MGKGKERRGSRQPDFEDAAEETMGSGSPSASLERSPRQNTFCYSEELVPKFSGQDNTVSSVKWAQDLEENAEIFGWTPLQQLIVARRSLIGTAALWLKSEKTFKTWDDLKTGLLKEFPDAIDVKTIHEMMSARKKKPGESSIDYLLTMKELGKRGKMPDYVAIKYIIDGIVDVETNKIMLYGATTYSDLKEKLKIYELVKEKMKNSSNRQSANFMMDMPPRRNSYEAKKCYNCGENEHMSAVCPHKDKGLKCFKCNLFGHVAAHCNVNNNGDHHQHGAGAVGGSSGIDNQRRQVGNIAWQKRSGSLGAKQEKNSSTYCCQCEHEECETDRTQDGGNDDVLLTADVMNLNVNDGKGIKKPIKIVEICGKKIDALIDSGSEVNLMSSACFHETELPMYEETRIVLKGLGATQVRSLGMLSCTVKIDGQIFKNVSFYIVPDNVTPYSIIIGQQLLQHTVMVMDKSSVFFLPSNEEWLRNITCFVSDLQITGLEVQPGIQPQVRGTIGESQPLRTKEEPCQLRIHHKDDVSAAQRPRRFAIKEQQEVSAQIKQQQDDGIIRVSTCGRKYNRRKKGSQPNAVDNVVATTRTQFGVGPKARPKHLGHYRAMAVEGEDRHTVGKLGTLKEDPRSTMTAADFMKHWPAYADSSGGV